MSSCPFALVIAIPQACYSNKIIKHSVNTHSVLYNMGSCPLAVTSPKHNGNSIARTLLVGASYGLDSCPFAA